MSKNVYSDLIALLFPISVLSNVGTFNRHRRDSRILRAVDQKILNT